MGPQKNQQKQEDVSKTTKTEKDIYAQLAQTVNSCSKFAKKKKGKTSDYEMCLSEDI